MRATTVTVGVPVRDLDAATHWYRSAFELEGPEVRPMDGLVEFDLGPFWVQLVDAPGLAGQTGMSVNISVEDATRERSRMAELGLDVSEVRRFEGVVDYFELTDPDGNTIGVVTELA